LERVQRRAMKWGVWSTSVIGSSWGKRGGSVWRRGSSAQRRQRQSLQLAEKSSGEGGRPLPPGNSSMIRMASSCTRGGPGWVLGTICSQKEWQCIRTDCPGRWWGHCPWRCSRTVEMWHWGTWWDGLGLDLGILEVFSNLNGSMKLITNRIQLMFVSWLIENKS